MARSLRQSLNRAVSLLRREYNTPEYPFRGETCLVLRGEYEKYKTDCQQSVKNERKRKVCTSALDSLKRLFDGSCQHCDPAQKRKATLDWAQKALLTDVPRSCSESVLLWVPILKTHVRRLVKGWSMQGSDSPVMDDVYVPDRQGCYETAQHLGGSLGTSYEEENVSNNVLRVGVAKTKGKFRVVTMQSSRVKRVLAPVHNALYNHITRGKWCVRGNVRVADFRDVIKDLVPGEKIISGDYTSATDNIYLPAVRAIIDVVIEECRDMPEEVKVVLRESFGPSVVRADIGGGQSFFRLKRGSMMGNLVSFPLLCLLNKACFDICNSLSGRGQRVGKFNGDDCLFTGDANFYNLWRSVTSHFGLIVNEEKTGVSSRWACLNSTWYDGYTRSILAKPVLSFLRKDRLEPGEILSSIITGLSSFKQDIVMATICQMMRYEIVLRGVTGSLSSISKAWRDRLLRKRWFRDAVMASPHTTRTAGIIREYAYTNERVIKEDYHAMVDILCDDSQASWVQRWKGVKADNNFIELPRKRRKNGKFYHLGFSRVILDRKGFRHGNIPRISSRAKISFSKVWGSVLPLSVCEHLRDPSMEKLVFGWENNSWTTDYRSLVVKMRATTIGDLKKIFPSPHQFSYSSPVGGGVWVCGGSF